jgi:peptidoglycan/xylan/chitin deacetylase (PgdA/CDA1 family)
MSHKRWMKKAQLAVLVVVGISAVSIPMTVTMLLSATTGGSPLVLGKTARTRTVPTNPAKAITQALKCAPKKGYYALTFDDGPYPETAERLVGALAGAGAVATFFDVGQRVDARPDLVQLQRTVGQVANHSYTHAHLPQVSRERRFQELTETAKALDHPNAFVRPPFGETSPATDADIEKTGLVPVYWTTDTYDWQKPPVEVIVQRALAVQPGGIVLLHDGRENTILAVPRIVSELSGRGMCPGFLAQTDKTVVSPYRQTPFNVVAVSPKNDSGLAAPVEPGRRP